LVVRPQRDRVLELVDPVVEVRQDREEAVDERVDDPIQDPGRTLDRVLAFRVALADLGEGGTVVLVHGDEEPLRVEAVHLDEPVLVGCRAVDDDEDEVVVLVDLGPLAKALRVLDGEWVELEDVAQDLEVARLRLREIEPEELAAGKELLDLAAFEMHLAAAV